MVPYPLETDAQQPGRARAVLSRGSRCSRGRAPRTRSRSSSRRPRCSSS